MDASVLKRLLLVLTAVAFVFATVLPNCVGATQMHDGMAMTAPMTTPCADCPDKVPANEFAKMCGALACAGLVALPVRQVTCLPEFGKFLYPPSVVQYSLGISLAPDPFPPKPVRA